MKLTLLSPLRLHPSGTTGAPPFSSTKMGEDGGAGGVRVDAGGVRRPGADAYVDANDGGHRNPHSHHRLVPTHGHPHGFTDGSRPPPRRMTAPARGDLLFSELLRPPAFWNTASSAQASAMVTNNRLVLSITAAGTALHRQPAQPAERGRLLRRGHGEISACAAATTSTGCSFAPPAAGIITVRAQLQRPGAAGTRARRSDLSAAGLAVQQ